MTQCRECGNLIAYFEGKIFCEGNPEEAIDEGNRSKFDYVQFDHFECDTNADVILNVDVDKERECDGFEEGKPIKIE